jgi:hypothetical protein
VADTQAGATKIMVIRHAEKPDKYNGQQYNGVDVYGSSGAEDLVTLGWERAGGLVTLFAPPWGPKGPTLATPQYLYAADPKDKSAPDAKTKEPSQRPYETLGPLAAVLGLTINAGFKKKDFKDMVANAITQPGVVLISWQHEDIALGESGSHGISHYILKDTGTTDSFNIPTTWPVDSKGKARYDLVFVFDRPTGTGPITAFSMFAQMLLAGDSAAPQAATAAAAQPAKLSG